MADNQIKFYRGNRPADLASANLDPNAIYFFADMGEIYTGGKTYGMSEAQTQQFNERLSSIEGDAAALEGVVDQLLTVIGTVEGYSKDSVLGRLDVIEEKVSANIDAISALDENLTTLDTYVGDIPTGYEEQETIVAYINKKAEETLAAANGGSSESAASVKAALDTHKAENEASFRAVDESIQAVGAIAQGAQDELDAFKAAADVSEKAIDTLKEIQDYIASDGAAAETMVADIAAAKKAGDDAQAAADLAQETAEAAQDAADEAAAAAEAAAGVAAQSVANAATAQAAAEAADAKAVAADGKAVAADAKAQAAQDAVDALEEVVDGKAAQADLEAAVERIEANEDAIGTLQGASHTHDNKEVLDGINADKISAWDAAEQNAKNYADSLLVWNAIA